MFSLVYDDLVSIDKSFFCVVYKWYIYICMLKLVLHETYMHMYVGFIYAWETCMYVYVWCKKKIFLHENYLNAVILKLASILCNKIYFELINIFFK